MKQLSRWFGDQIRALRRQPAWGSQGEAMQDNPTWRAGRDVSELEALRDEAKRLEAGRVNEHEGMMTRREVLEWLCYWHRQRSHKHTWAAVRILGVCWDPDGNEESVACFVCNAAHELALLMDAERGDDDE